MDGSAAHLLTPDARRIVEIAAADPGYFLDAWWETFRISAMASAASVLLAIVVAVVVVRWRPLRRLFEPLVVVSQSFPLQAIAPLIVITLGRGSSTKLAIALLIAFFPLFGQVLAALENVPLALLAFARTTGSSPTRQLLMVSLPASVPAIVAGAKVSFTLAVLGTVVAEFVEPSAGIGRLIVRAQSDYNLEIIYLCIAMLIVQGLAVYGVLSFLESRLRSTWRA